MGVESAIVSDKILRLAAFEKLRRLQQFYGKVLPWEAIENGFEFDGEKILFASRAEGIFKPRQMDRIISVKTVVPREGRKTWYLDQSISDQSTNYQENGFSYSFKGNDPKNKQNKLLLTAMLEKTPIIYFIGISPAHYEPIYPSTAVRLTVWRNRQSVHV